MIVFAFGEGVNGYLAAFASGGLYKLVECPLCFNRPRRVLRMGPQVLSEFPQQDNYSRSLVSQYQPRIVASPPLDLWLISSKISEIKAAYEILEKEFGKLDVLVNNAGIGPPNAIEDVTEEDFDYTVEVNLKGTFFVSQYAGKLMKRNKYGRIVNLSSQAGFIALPTESVYCMTKAGIAHLTKCFAVEWGKYNITVNAVAPTFIYTPGTEEALADADFKADVIERIAGLHRIGEPMEVAGAVVFLASPAASLITGDTLMIDGGWTAR